MAKDEAVNSYVVTIGRVPLRMRLTATMAKRYPGAQLWAGEKAAVPENKALAPLNKSSQRRRSS